MINKKYKKVLFFIMLIFLFLGIVNATDVDSNETLVKEHDSSMTNDEIFLIEDTYSHKTDDEKLDETDDTQNINEKQALIEVDEISETQYYDPVSISGNLKDSNGNSLSNSSLNININGKDYQTNTNINGLFKYNTKATVIGKNNVSVTFTGDSYNTKTSTKVNYNVIAKDTKVITWIVFIIFFIIAINLYYTSPQFANDDKILLFLSSIVFGLVFAVPTFVIGWLISLELSIDNSWLRRTLLKASQVGALIKRSRTLIIR